MKLYLSSLVLTLITYSQIIKGFFQQDEWFGLSEYILRKGFGWYDLFGYFFAPSIVHYTPFTLMTLYATLSVFGINYSAYAVISITLHLVVVILLFVLLKKLFRSESLAGVGVLLFASFSSIHQATSWVMADIGTHGSTIFGILSIIFFVDFLETRSNNKFYYSIFTLFVSLMFKEITIGLFAILIFLLLGNKKFKTQQKTKYISKIIIFGILYVIARLIMIPFVSVQSGDAGLVFESQNYTKILYDFLTIPIKAISQSIIPIEIMRGLSEFVARLFPRTISSEIGSPAFEMFVVKRVLEFVSLSLSLIIGIWVLLKKNRTRTILLGVIWIIVNSFIFAFSPQRTGITSVIDSRNLYLVSIGAVLMLTTVFEKIRRRNKMASIIFISIILFPNLFFLNQNLSNFVKVSSVRKEILNHIKKIVPQLPQKVVIYTQSSQSYYGLPEDKKIMPFQSGFGQTLLVWYYQRNKFPKDFFEDRFLWEIDSQSYKEVNGVGFGYFRDLDLLKEAIKQYNLPKESVIAFKWISAENKLLDITIEVREKIYGQINK